LPLLKFQPSYYPNDQIKTNEMTWPFSTNMEQERCVQGFVGETWRK